MIAGEGGRFPATDTSRFDAGTGEVSVYVRLEDSPPRARLVAAVERSGRSSVVSGIFGRAEIEAVRVGEGRLSSSGDDISGVVGFVVRPRDGETLPSGEYTVRLRFDDGRPAAREYFVVG